jgi:hypothetical protein
MSRSDVVPVDGSKLVVLEHTRSFLVVEYGEDLQRLEATRRAASEWHKNGRAEAWLVHAGDQLTRVQVRQGQTLG